MSGDADKKRWAQWFDRQMSEALTTLGASKPNSESERRMIAAMKARAIDILMGTPAAAVRSEAAPAPSADPPAAPAQGASESSLPPSPAGGAT